MLKLDTTTSPKPISRIREVLAEKSKSDAKLQSLLNYGQATDTADRGSKSKSKSDETASNPTDFVTVRPQKKRKVNK